MNVPFSFTANVIIYSDNIKTTRNLFFFFFRSLILHHWKKEKKRKPLYQKTSRTHPRQNIFVSWILYKTLCGIEFFIDQHVWENACIEYQKQKIQFFFSPPKSIFFVFFIHLFLENKQLSKECSFNSEFKG